MKFPLKKMIFEIPQFCKHTIKYIYGKKESMRLQLYNIKDKFDVIKFMGKTQNAPCRLNTLQLQLIQVLVARYNNSIL